MRQFSEESGGGKEIIGNAEVHGGCGVVKMVREPVSREDKETAKSPVIPVREAETVETVVSDASYQAIGGYRVETG